MSTSPLLGLSYWLPGTSSPQSYQNDAVTRLDLFAANTVKSRTTAAQPGSPTVGDAYILPTSPTGTDWASFDAGDLVQAIKDATGTSVTYWVRYAPIDGMPIHVQDTGEVVEWGGAAYSILVPRRTVLALTATTTAGPTREIVASDGSRQTLLLDASTTGTLTLDASALSGYSGDVWFWIYNGSGGSITAVDGTGWQDTTFSQAIANGETLAVHGYWDNEKLYIVNTYVTTGDDRPA